MDKITKSKSKSKTKSKKATKPRQDDGVDDFVDALLADGDDGDEGRPRKKKSKKSKSSSAKKQKRSSAKKEAADESQYNDDDVQDLYAWDSADEEEEQAEEPQSAPAEARKNMKPAVAETMQVDEDADAEAAARRAERQRALSLALMVADDTEKGGNRDLPRDADDWFEKLDEETKDKAAANHRKRKRGSEETSAAAAAAATYADSDSDADMPTDIVKSRDTASESNSKMRPMVAAAAIPREKREAVGKFLAVDCEMVGAGFKGSRSMLARVSVVNYYGHVVLDTFVRPAEKVTDYRTWVSGIRKSDLDKGRPFREVQEQVAELFKDRVIVGHAIQHDLKALMLTHPPLMIRDTAKFPGFKKMSKGSAPALRKLAASVLNITIQEGEHSSVTDAKTTMLLYRKVKDEWERLLAPKRYKVQVKKAKTKERFAQLRQEIQQQQQQQQKR
ncbi:hypothetical protein GQ54DRAFT_297291 [Martensiomyces pterosporus]|nr:hypothetical protein GQ54DRAFT_297291 [Martensiomyces pterosporus]